jgi:Cation transport ATPase (P-type)
MGELLFTPSGPKALDLEKEDHGDAHSHEKLLKDNGALEDFLFTASLANLATVHETKGEWHARGDPTEIAIQVFASRFDFNRRKFLDSQAEWKQMSEYPFDSDVKRMSVIFEHLPTRNQMVFTKGAVERIIDSCESIVWDSSEVVDMTNTMRNAVLENMEALASLGLRVLALASRPYNPRSGRRASREGPPPREEVERNLVFRGLIGLYDPPRPESAQSVKACHSAGISVHMLTGDHPGTARAIAAQVGILPNMDIVAKDVADSMVMTAKKFDQLSDNDIDKLPVLPLVIARCAPQTKVRMIEALHRRKAFAAMVRIFLYFPSPTTINHTNIPSLDRRRRQRLPLPQTRRRRHRHGRIGLRRRQGRVRDHPHRRQLRLDPQRHRRGPPHVRQHPEIRPAPPRAEHRPGMHPAHRARLQGLLALVRLPARAGRDLMDHHDHVRSSRHGPGDGDRGAGHPGASAPGPQARRLHHRSHGRHARIRPVDVGPVSLRLQPRNVRLRRRDPGPELQRRVLGIVRHRLPRPRHHVRVSDLVLVVSGVGGRGPEEELLPHAAGLQSLLHPVGAGCVEESIPVLECDCGVFYYLSDVVYTRDKSRCLQAYGHRLGVGDRICGGGGVLRGV